MNRFAQLIQRSGEVNGMNEKALFNKGSKYNFLWNAKCNLWKLTEEMLFDD